MLELLTKVHVAATLAMVGVIWVVQTVQYPAFAKVGVERFADYHAAHMRGISLVVVPLMLAEATTGLLLVALAGWSASAGFAISLALLGLAWAATFLIQVPQHRRLESGYCPAIARALVRGNWLRTVAWTARAVLLLGCIPGVIQP